MDALSFLLGSLGAHEWKRLLSLVSPSFFRVVPFGELAGAVKRGIAQSRDNEAFQRGLASLPRVFTSRDSGDAALQLYFRQILGRQECLLDLSREAFLHVERTSESPHWEWRPSKLRYVFSAQFSQGLADVYRGFYREDAVAFARGLEALGLEGCGELFRAHFGNGDQTAVTFRVSHFVETFHSIFQECKRRGLILGGDFVALGVALGLLYEHLEKATPERTWNVRAAFLLADVPWDPNESGAKKGSASGRASQEVTQ
ncbi:MAG: hypothetical protein IOD12_15365 [Silvanigrellales bacterium]|nr:hypothetical protein [Silvanigrellales bacterium]